ncbi:cytochrome P450 [Mycolicibacterium fortuitum subsp. fortuitum DSM 46621 = ATCC 6841 = JCM 6387]|uniref:Cytochrome P450 n=2 Tax=Mycolicibacterium fortuitum TaxID=1766 RepID=K0V9D9_MYCFO|nr:cytochrome P450 [Mycolicibacterium fortuitum subsp. fortuitum DSM 46621 = ATCC 6841 = JCM 6387]
MPQPVQAWLRHRRGDGSALSTPAFTFASAKVGGVTTTRLLGGSTPLLHTQPDQRWQLLEIGLILDAVEELLRLISPVQA